jgi:putative ABC transport system ATP-binding protein
VNTVFQDYALFPHMSVGDNVGYGLVVRKVARPERTERVRDALRMVQLEGYEGRKPSQLSGGQRQRVAIARALVSSPKLVLADEPTANLDSRTSASILALMRALQEERRTSFVIASHDPRVIAEADDHVSVSDGRVTSVIRKEASIGDHAHENALART